MVMPYHLHMPSYFLETFTEYPYINLRLCSSSHNSHNTHQYNLFHLSFVLKIKH